MLSRGDIMKLCFGENAPDRRVESTERRERLQVEKPVRRPPDCPLD